VKPSAELPRLSSGFSPLQSSPVRVLRIALILLSAALIVIPAHAQNKKTDDALRTVHGTTLDKDENPVASSVVYLVNVKTQAITTRIADDSGNYRFSGLDPNVDYEIHAEHSEMASPTRTISSFDSRRDIEVILKLSHKKSPH
jgi:Carboxypeptidase regulatory-like domain